jgi:hypothetical protein
MSNQVHPGGQCRTNLRAAGDDPTFNAWLHRHLAEEYDRTLYEPLPDALIRLLDEAFERK